MSDLDRKDRIDAIAQKLSAMLTITVGEGCQSFRNFFHQIQEVYNLSVTHIARAH